MEVTVGLGSNIDGPIGTPEDTLQWALIHLERFLAGGRVSSLHRTAPHHVTDQPWYCNRVFIGSTCNGPHRVLEELLRIEAAAGRDRSREIRFGPRTLDLDLLTYGRYVITATDLQVPHPRMHERSFVMKPLLEIAPVGVDPRSGRSWQSLVSGMDPAAP